MTESYSRYGDPDILINIINEAGALPTRNFSSGRFKGAENVAGETLNKVTLERKGKTTEGCMSGCIIRCSGTFLDKNGEEYFRHEGYFPLEELVKVLKQKGVQ